MIMSTLKVEIYSKDVRIAAEVVTIIIINHSIKTEK